MSQKSRTPHLHIKRRNEIKPANRQQIKVRRGGASNMLQRYETQIQGNNFYSIYISLHNHCPV